MKTFTDPNVRIPDITERDIDKSFVIIQLTSEYGLIYMGVAQKVGPDFKWKGTSIISDNFLFWSAVTGTSLMDLIIKSYQHFGVENNWKVSFFVIESWIEFRDFLVKEVP